MLVVIFVDFIKSIIKENLEAFMFHRSQLCRGQLGSISNFPFERTVLSVGTSVPLTIWH